MKKLIIALLFSPIVASAQQCIPGDFGGVGTNMFTYKMSDTWCLTWMCPVVQPSKRILMARVIMPLNIIPMNNKNVKAIIPDSAEGIIKAWKEVLNTDSAEQQYTCNAFMEGPDEDQRQIRTDRED